MLAIGIATSVMEIEPAFGLKENFGSPTRFEDSILVAICAVKDCAVATPPHECKR